MLKRNFKEINKVLKQAIFTKYSLPIFIFLLSIGIRLIFLFYVFPDNRHSFAEYYGSAAIGLSQGKGTTYNLKEVERIKLTVNNFSGNYIEFEENNERSPLLYTLPGPAYIMAALWSVLPTKNFLPYLLLQILLDSLVIALFFRLFVNNLNNYIVYIVTLFLILNPIAISKTVMVSYDFWAPFCVIVNFTGIYYVILKDKSNWILLLTGVVTAITLWFRDIINFLPFFIAIGIFLYYKMNRKLAIKPVLLKVLIYFLPVLISLGSLSLYRNHYTGSYRPTQTFFWHAFFCAIGQFENPYGIRPNDMDVWNLGSMLNKEVKFKDQFKYSESTNNIYEETLKREGIKFVKTYPHLFIRNMVYRTSMMISPLFFTQSTSPTKSLFSKGIMQFFGVILFILWIMGIVHMFRKKDPILFVSLPIYLYFFAVFSWYYLIGRVMLCFAFLNLIVYFFGFIYLISIIKNSRVVQKAISNLINS